MKRFLSLLLWTAVFCGLLLALDQALLRLPLQRPEPLAAVRDFYVDFRERLLHLSFKPVPTKAPPAVRRNEAPEPSGHPASTPPGSRPAAALPAAEPKGSDRPHPTPPPMRYVYVDSAGTLQFADRLEAVPPAFRKAARPLEP